MNLPICHATHDASSRALSIDGADLRSQPNLSLSRPRFFATNHVVIVKEVFLPLAARKRFVRWMTPAVCGLLILGSVQAQSIRIPWSGYGHTAQHDAITSVDRKSVV